MSEEQDYVVVTIGENSDVDVVIVGESDTEVTEDTSSTEEVLAVQPDFESNNENSQQPSQLSYEVEDLEAVGDQEASQMNHLTNLKRCNPNSEEMQFMPLCKKGQSSGPGVDNVDLMGLHELMQNMNRQINRLCEIVSQMQRSLEKPSSINCGDHSSSLPAERQKDNAGTNLTGGTPRQSAALPEVQQPVLKESSPLPRIVSTYSLQPHVTPDSKSPGFGVPYFVNEAAESTSSVISSAQATLAVPTALLPQGEASLADISETVNYSAIIGNNSMGPYTALPCFCIPPNIEMPREAEIIAENSTESMYYPTLLGGDSGQDTSSSSIFIPANSAMPERVETSLEHNPETMSYPTLLGNDSGQCSSSVSLPPNFAVEKLILIEMPAKAETGLENSSQTVFYPALLGNINGPVTESSSHSLPPNFAVEKFLLMGVPGQAVTSVENSSQTVHYSTIVENNSGPDTTFSTVSIPPNFEMLVKAETSLENNTEVTHHPAFLQDDSDEGASYLFIPQDSDESVTLHITKSSTEMNSETVNCAPVMENDNNQDTDPKSYFLTSAFGYLGDPRRNVRMLNTHLMTVQKKTEPKHAALYLVHILFSKKILISSSVGANSQGRQPLDPNKMAAIREHLAAIFPNYDLRECGKDWQACISDINSLICRLCSKRTPQKTVHNNIEPTNPDTDSNDKRDGDNSESSSQVPQQAAGSETRENGNSQNSSALPAGIKTPSTDNSTVFYETLEYLGNPRRNVQLPKSVLNTAKDKARPVLAARYLVRHLFPEQVLIKSNVYGNQGRGVCALNANKINALREFLQDFYPTCDLTEAGYDWKLCVAAINSCIYRLRFDLKKSTSKSQPLPAATPSTE